MPTYKYKALTPDRKEVSGVIEAYDELAAIDRIKATCPIVISIEQVAEKKSVLQMEIGHSKIKLKALSVMCSQFASTLQAGMPVVRTVRLMAAQTKDKNLHKLLEEVADDVDEGYGLAQSFENKGKDMLPDTFIETVRAGENSGTLEASLKRLETYFGNEAMVKDKVRSAMMYPMFLSILAVVVIGIVLGVAMPVFTDIFAEMEIELPALTRGVIGVTNFFARWWYVFLIAIILIVVLYKLYASSEDGKMRISKLRTKLPVIGKVVQMKAGSQLANTMSTLLTAGLPVVRTVGITAKVMDNYYMGLRLGAAVPKLKEGNRFGDCLAACECFPDMLVEMAAMGEESGALDSTLETVGRHYDNEVDLATKRAMGMLQPAITVVMGVFIGIIVVALYMPMFSMYSGM